MDLQNTHTTPEQPQNDTLPDSHFWHKHKRLIIISSICFLLLAAAGVTFLLLHYKNNSTTNQAAQSTKKTTASTQSQTTQKSAMPANTWVGSVDPKALPLGDNNVSTTPKVGYIMSCTTHFNGRGSMHAGDWIDTANNTWNSEGKVSVAGSVSWEQATYSVVSSGDNRIITTNNLPMGFTTGTFPIKSSDPAYQYDRNPNSILAHNTTLTLPLNPTAASSPSCTGLGAIGVLDNGVFLFNGLDAAGRDAVAHETQDSCGGHPDGQEEYHYHDIPPCIMSKTTNSTSTLVGYALDGYGIYVERDSKGNLPTNADLDECHGRTSQVNWNGAMTNIYHYDATLEFPYTIGCYRGNPVKLH